MKRIIFTVLLDLIILILIIISIFLAYRFYRAYQTNSSLVATLFDNKDLLKQLHIIKEDEWLTYDAPSFTFDYPQSWDPRLRELLGGETELVDLKIPVFMSISKLGANNVIGYSKEDPARRRPTTDLMVEQDFTMGNRKATKWIYKKDGYIQYEYIISLQRYSLNGKNVSSFYLHVESPSKNSGLEEQLDQVAASLKFKADDEESHF